MTKVTRLESVLLSEFRIRYRRAHRRSRMLGVAPVLGAVLLWCSAWVGCADASEAGSDARNHTARTSAAGSSGTLVCLRCNLILLNIDLLRADYVGLIRPGRGLTPNIDRFFADGLIFEDVSSGSGATYLSATATATGTEAMFNTHDIWDMKPGGGSWRVPWMVQREGRLLIDMMPTLAETVRVTGYHTIAVNDWIHSGRRVNLGRGFTDYVELPLLGSMFERQTEKVVSILEKQNTEPYYLYFHSNALHFKLYFPADRVNTDGEFGRQLRQLGVSKDGALVFDARKPGLPVKLVWAAYAEQLRYIDEQLGKLFQVLEELGLENTIVVLYANHGVDINKEGKLGVGLPYRNYLHVPLLIRHPRVKVAKRIGAMTSLVDLAPTIYDLLGISPQQPLTTYSMLPLLTGGQYSREFAFSRDIQFESVRNAEWKLVVSGGIKKTLYNLHADPREENDLYDPRLPVVRRLMSALIQTRLQQTKYAAGLRISLKQQGVE